MQTVPSVEIFKVAGKTFVSIEKLNVLWQLSIVWNKLQNSNRYFLSNFV